MKKILKWILPALLVALALLQLKNPARTNPPVVHDFLAATAPPEKIGALFRAACYDCHSSETKWPWYSRIAPVSWLVADDVAEGRENLNLSDWPQKRADWSARRLENMSEEIQEGEMPPKKYSLIHADARLTEGQRKAMADWLDAAAANLKSASDSTR